MWKVVNLDHRTEYLTPGYNFCYTVIMKTAISIPDNVFESAEKLSKRLGQSRSQLYTNALRSYTEKHRDDNVTAKLNETYNSEPSDLDPVLVSLQNEAWIKNNPW